MHFSSNCSYMLNITQISRALTLRVSYQTEKACLFCCVRCFLFRRESMRTIRQFFKYRPSIRTVSLPLSVLTSIFRWTWVSRYQNVSTLDFIGAEGDRGGDDNWSYKTRKTSVKSSPSTNRHPTFYRPDALPGAQTLYTRCNAMIVSSVDSSINVPLR